MDKRPVLRTLEVTCEDEKVMRELEIIIRNVREKHGYSGHTSRHTHYPDGTYKREIGFIK